MEPEKIHIMPLGDHWEIETQSGQPLAQEEDKASAVGTARELARDQHIETIILHDGDGVTEQVPAAPKPSDPGGED